MGIVYVTGQDVGVTTTALTATGQPATGALAVTLTVTNPLGATTTPATASAGSGVYTAVVPSVAVPGVWLYRWTATGGGVAWADEGQFQVRPLGMEQLVDLASVKAHLNLNMADTRQDDELIGFILAASELARDVVGPILPETHTEWHNGGTRTLVLDWLPVASVLSVTEYIAATSWTLTEQPLGTSTDAYGYTVDLDLGQITRRAVGGAVPFPRGTMNVKVVYTAGRGGAVPWTVRLGALELIRHLWQLTQQRGGRSPVGGSVLDSDGGSGVPSGFALPNRVLELWKPYKRPPGIA